MRRRRSGRLSRTGRAAGHGLTASKPRCCKHTVPQWPPARTGARSGGQTRRDVYRLCWPEWTWLSALSAWHYGVGSRSRTERITSRGRAREAARALPAAGARDAPLRPGTCVAAVRPSPDCSSLRRWVRIRAAYGLSCATYNRPPRHRHPAPLIRWRPRLPPSASAPVLHHKGRSPCRTISLNVSTPSRRTSIPAMSASRSRIRKRPASKAA
jgi:hypothetical protein